MFLGNINNCQKVVYFKKGADKLPQTQLVSEAQATQERDGFQDRRL